MFLYKYREITKNYIFVTTTIFISENESER